MDHSSILNNIQTQTWQQKKCEPNPEVLEQGYGTKDGQISLNLIENAPFIPELMNQTLSTYFGCTFPSSGMSVPINQPVISPGRNPISLDKNLVTAIPAGSEEFMNYASNQHKYEQLKYLPRATSAKPSDLPHKYLQANPDMDQTSSQNETSLGKIPASCMNQNREQLLKEVRNLKNVDPLFNSKNQGTIAEVLVKVLREYLCQIPLDDFYNMLYTRQEQMARPPIDGIKLHRAIPTEKGLEGLKLCKGIMENLFLETSDGSSEPQTGNQDHSPLLNKHEIIRIFLAIKIIFDAVQVVENSSKSEAFLLRASIYNSYYIICQKLSQKYRTCSNSIDLQFDIILSQSRFGRVFKLNFPDLNANRLGRRGNSKYCYREITWNKLLIDEGIKKLAEGNLSDIKNCFKRTQRDRKESGFNNLEPVFLDNLGHNLGLKLNPGIQLIKIADRKPLYSFVDLSNKFPGSYCSLRIWKIVSGKLPKQSQWSIETMNNSLEALKHHGIDVAASIYYLQTQGLSPESLNWFLEDALQKIQILMEAYASEDAYLHLYLVVTLLISPVVFASDHELKTDCKPKLFTYLSIFVERLEADLF